MTAFNAVELGAKILVPDKDARSLESDVFALALDILEGRILDEYPWTDIVEVAKERDAVLRGTFLIVIGEYWKAVND